MNKRIILSLGLAALLSSSVFADNMSCDKGNKEFGKCGKGVMKHNNHEGDRFMPLVMKLNLSDEQRKKIDEIMQENMKNMSNMPNMSDAFSDKDFDKKLFVKLQKEKNEKKTERKAQMIESIYAILTPTQKQEFKKIVDEKAAAKKEFFKGSKNQ
ncbi:MAG: hypothetical protein A2513_10300 [Sulfurimonas sp. RIFOXYD12_FULL_33_39]|uniref:Spy/CpxP family protein refolding chaperone n=1 Tax=unclassified Sulfurimonas TaxID=2623549 RepID=UPI0008C805B1|nr:MULTISPECIES: Spy/CpxP family protein refolding chaperone [unclassified Sulfurimonas]OHE06513.1 MAG: hypothetical protein A3G74_03340 [Sulfurimonas sp. RIFCSPLOWO2_12_FULL_34_6]OHE09703.1 MAG: hypothetical protein A2513_10300 [Sulfurimonas sp. RIFOXYD12_FULL_33_39]OHE13789.1 MAG: hypothetical protein A2530_09455 [Sulfurimonas sp. RIFOXYD2_FULL_34_21]DAB28712.1 MAG TPA: hypothetical protein CFH78_01180 [Sulfurimonas sp. UBA10385]